MLKRVSIQNFKSLKDVTLNLQKVNLLIGPNNSGKTNFLKALEFLSMRLDTYFDDKNSTYSFLHSDKAFISIKLVSDRYDNFFQKNACENISLSFNNLPRGRVLEYWHSDGLDDPYQGNTQLYSVFDSSFLSNMQERPDAEMSKGFYENTQVYRDILIYKPDPNKINKAAPVGEGTDTVNADASNLVAFLDYILSEYRSTFSQIERDLHKCVPEFTEINLQNVKPTNGLVKQFGDKTFKRLGLTNGSQNIKYWADELSEGTLYFLALLCIINQPSPPKVLLLEEPEKGIHPRRIREVMDFIFRLAEEKDVQIIMTTHNENVLNEFTSMPESVFVFEKNEEGATQVKNLLSDIIEPSHQRSRDNDTKEIDFTSNLGENWMYGLLGGVPEEAL